MVSLREWGNGDWGIGGRVSLCRVAVGDGLDRSIGLDGLVGWVDGWMDG